MLTARGAAAGTFMMCMYASDAMPPLLRVRLRLRPIPAWGIAKTSLRRRQSSTVATLPASTCSTVPTDELLDAEVPGRERSWALTIRCSGRSGVVGEQQGSWPEHGALRNCTPLAPRPRLSADPPDEKTPDYRGLLDSGGGIRTRDLRVMSPTSYQTAPPRVAMEVLAENGALASPPCVWRSSTSERTRPGC